MSVAGLYETNLSENEVGPAGEITGAVAVACWAQRCTATRQRPEGTTYSVVGLDLGMGPVMVFSVS